MLYGQGTQFDVGTHRGAVCGLEGLQLGFDRYGNSEEELLSLLVSSDITLVPLPTEGTIVEYINFALGKI